uniref:(northern house mosquito) hypothetical protein n=1 Tax=Culex pipiens TaxID=7175 RepID=A0A8D8K4Z7_CULPI
MSRTATSLHSHGQMRQFWTFQVVEALLVVKMKNLQPFEVIRVVAYDNIALITNGNLQANNLRNFAKEPGVKLHWQLIKINEMQVFHVCQRDHLTRGQIQFQAGVVLDIVRKNGQDQHTRTQSVHEPHNPLQIVLVKA